MWAVIETRLGRRWWILAAVSAAGALAAVVFAAAEPEARRPELLALVATTVALAGVVIAQKTVNTVDCRESRSALHFSLPLPRRRLILLQVVEPMLMALIPAIVGLGAAVLGRLALGRAWYTPELLLLVVVTGIVLTLEQIQILTEELRRMGWWRGALILAIAAFAGAFGAGVGYVIGTWIRMEAPPSAALVVLFARVDLAVAFALIAALLAELNRRLITLRTNDLA